MFYYKYKLKRIDLKEKSNYIFLFNFVIYIIKILNVIFSLNNIKML